jgi:hypothetical protein
MAQMSRVVILCLWLITNAAWCETRAEEEYGWRENGVIVPDTPSKAHDGPFLVHMFVVDDAERLYRDWFNKPENPRARHVATARPGTEIEVVVVFVHCQADTSGNCQVWGTATVTTSDGRTLIDKAAVPLYVNHPPLPGAALGISEHGLGMVIEELEGSYKFEMLVEDRVSGRKVALVQELAADNSARAPSN